MIIGLTKNCVIGSCIYLFLLFSTSSYGQTFAGNGMVVSDSQVGSNVGVDILKQGGNAIDASIATAFALAVTYPQAGNIGGGGFLVFRHSNGSATTIDFREKAPLAASSTMFLNEQGQFIKGTNHCGLKSVGVPGTVAGLYFAHQKYGKLDWKSLLQPAINLAENGFEMTWYLYDWAKKIDNWNPSKDIMKSYFKDQNDEIIEPGNLWKQPALARTLKLIRDFGSDGFYKGSVANEIEEYMKRNGGIITKEDLIQYAPIERKVLKGTFKEYEILTMPPPSSGGIALLEMMNLMELSNLDSIEFNSTEYVHLITEVMRRAFADRAQYLGDPDFNLNIPLDRLSSKEFARMRYKNIDSSKASVSDSSKFGQIYDGSSTTHISVVDKDRNAVSLTYTLEHSFGSGMGSEKLGFIFNNEMGDFNPVEGMTTQDGLIGTNPNLIAPGKRMLSSMTPVIVTKGDSLYLVVGSPGGRTIINTVFQTVLAVLAYEMTIEDAIEVMKIHHPWLPNKIYYENNLLSPDTRRRLEGMGHKLEEVDYLGKLMGIKIENSDKRLSGSSDSSSLDGGAVGY